MARSARKSPSVDQQVRKEQLLDETIRIIGERGFYGFTIQDLAQRCGLSNAGLLYYFPSKDLLLVAALEELERRETELIAPQLKRALFPGRVGPDAVIDLVRVLSEIGVADPEVLRMDVVLRAEALHPAHPAHATFMSREKRLLDLLARAIHSYADDPRATARRISAMMDGLGEHYLRANRNFDFVGECTRSVRALLNDAAKPVSAPPRARAKAAKAKRQSK